MAKSIFGKPDGPWSKRLNNVTKYIKGDMFGYRSWETFDDGLYSLVHAIGKPWKPGLQTAACTIAPEHHAPPVASCHCGYFGYYQRGYTAPKTDLNLFGNDHLWGNMNLHGVIYVSGVIRARGNVIMHEYGFRAESVEIMALSPMCHEEFRVAECPPCEPFAYLMPKILHGLSERYNVPTFETFADMYREYPPTNENETKQWEKMP